MEERKYLTNNPQRFNRGARAWRRRKRYAQEQVGQTYRNELMCWRVDTPFLMPEWAKGKGLPGLDVGETFIWTRNRWCMRHLERLGGMVTAIEYRKCGRCGFTHIGQSATQLRQQLDWPGGDKLTCDGSCEERIESAKERRRMTRKALLTTIAGLFLLCTGHLHAQSCVANSQVTIVGTLRASNGLPSSNLTLSLAPSQTGIISGCGVNVASAITCGTTTDGTAVGVPNPTVASIVTPQMGGSLGSGNYFIVIGWVDAAGNVSLPSPEAQAQLTGSGSLSVAVPVNGAPSNAAGMRVYIGTTSGAETLQGTSTPPSTFIQSVSLVSGSALPASNTTICKAVANDSIWPVGTGYIVSATDADGNALPGYPMQWQFTGAGTTVNLSNGLPYYHGVVFYPTPILSAPTNHATQSISSSLNFTGYNILNVGKVGCGTTLPAWSIDCPTINAGTGFLFDDAAPLNHTLCGNGTYYIDCDPGAYSYTSVAFNSTVATHRPTLNFTLRFKGTDSSSPAQTTVDLNSPGSGNLVATYGSAPSTSTFCATFDGSGNIIPASGICDAVSATVATPSNTYSVVYHNGALRRYVAINVEDESNCTYHALIGATASPTTTVGPQSIFSGGGFHVYTNLNFIVPPNWYYEALIDVGTCNLEHWNETDY